MPHAGGVTFIHGSGYNFGEGRWYLADALVFLRPMVMRLLRLALVPVLLPFSTGCLDSTRPLEESVAYLSSVAYLDGANSVLRLDGAFYVALNLSTGVGNPGDCQVGALQTGTATPPRTLEAGDALTASVSGNSAQVDRVAAGLNVTYHMQAGTGLTYTPGDTLQVVVPGAVGGFPATSIRVRTAEPFEIDPMVPPTANEPLTVFWTPPAVPGSLMTLALRYSTIAGSTLQNAEIYCVFADDGSGTVPALFASIYASTEEATRSYQFNRVRESQVFISSRVRARLFSFYPVPTPELGGT